MDEMSPKLQNQIAQFQQLQQQLQGVLQQKFRMEAQLKELEMTIEELKKATADTPMYKSVGSLMIAVKDKEALLKEIEDDKETAEIRVKTLDRQEKMFREKYQVMQDQISKALGQGPVAGEEEN
ncbi:MAG: prefoldin subunit beta [Euryarchaeota archaeon]|nr:prefoldin subunit beta [Euryarchaeota archaeon]